jgi:hypothetical protein
VHLRIPAIGFLAASTGPKQQTLPIPDNAHRSGPISFQGKEVSQCKQVQILSNKGCAPRLFEPY